MADPASTSAPVAPLEWRRVHRGTPFVRSWLFLAVVVFGAFRTLVEQGGDGGELALHHLGWVLLAVLALFAAAVAVGWVSWRATAYAIDDASVQMRSGVVAKRHRKARLDRVQAVDVTQPLLARLFGLAELKVEVAGGGDSSVAIGFLREEDARELRAEILARAAGAAPQAPARDQAASTPSGGDAGPGAGTTPAAVPDAAAHPAGPAAPAHAALPDAPAHAALPDAAVPGAAVPAGRAAYAPEAPEREVYEVPTGRLVASTLASAETVVLVLWLLATGGLLALTRQPGALVSSLPVLLGVGSAVVARVNRGFGFRAATSPDGIRLRHGLTETRAQTIPPGRVQAIKVSQPLLWRPFGWWRVSVDVAGYHGGGDKASTPSSTLHPVATLEEARSAVWLVLPDLGTDRPAELLTDGLTGRAGGPWFTSSPRRARWLDPLSWRRNGFAVTGRALLARRGVLRRRLVVVPHERTQSMSLEQGPVQRRLRLATVVLHSVPGPVRPAVVNLGAEVAGDLLVAQADRAATARAGDRSERWLEVRP